MKKLLGILSVVALIAGCDSTAEISKLEDKFTYEKELHWNVLGEDGGPQKMSLSASSLFAACIDEQAFVISTRGSTLAVEPVKDKNEYVSCSKPEFDNKYVRLMTIDKHRKFNEDGALSLCLGGYSFIHMNRHTDSNLFQLFNKDGSAKFCVPRDMTLINENQIPFIYPGLAEKVKEIEKILKIDKTDSKIF